MGNSFFCGWRLSTVLEVLKSTTGWDNNANRTDAFSFAAYPAGIYAGKNRFDFLGKYAFFWSSTEDGGVKDSE
ncbi:MAG: FISUMP domain-containing protein [Fibrobacter sp.]|nr:FISUMP domain-containing protein [Fibrobacter sp.]MDY6264003.1 FISUMP domain-containing protein [Fibrobacter sp.]